MLDRLTTWAGARGLHVRQERLGPVDHAPEVDVHDPAVVLQGQCPGGARQRDAGVVDDHVDGAVVGDDGVGPAVDGLLVGDVELGGGDPYLRPGERGGLGEARGVPVGQGEVAAVAREAQGQCAPDAGSGSGDRGGTTGEGLHRRLLTSGCGGRP
jgi:hypothetical protein